MDKKQREARRRQEDMALNRGLIWVGAAIVLELLLLFVKRYYINCRLSGSGVDLMLAIHGVLKALRIGCGALAVVCLIWAALRLKAGQKFVLPVILTLAFGAVGICAHVTLAFREAGVQMLLLLVPAWAGLALVYYLYQKEFFLSATAAGLSVLGLWTVRFGGGLRAEVAVILAGIVLVLAAALWLKKQSGVLTAAGRELRVLPQDASYTVILASGLAGLAAVILAAVLGATAAYYLIFLMVAWLFALLVYYTVKMM